MLMASFQKEWLIFRRDGRLLWLLITLLIMILAGIISSSYQYRNQQVLKAEAHNAERNRWINQGEKNPHSAAHYGMYLFKPATPLSVIDPGIGNYLGDALFLEAHKRNNSAFDASQDSIELQRLGTLSPASILQLLLPLFVILSGFGFFAAEREQGTLRMLLLSGKTPRQLFFQKALALFSFSLIFLLPIVIYSCFTFFTEGVLDVSRFIGVIVVYAGYVIFWVLFTLIVSIFASTARQALTILLIFWASSSLIIPKLAIDFAEQSSPGLATQEFYSRMESNLYTPERSQAIAQFKSDTLKKYAVSDTSDLPFNWAGAELLFSEAYSDKVFDRLFDQHIQLLKQQEKNYQKLAVFSPLIGIQVMSSGLATTDWYHHQLFTSAAEQHRRKVIHTLNSDMRDHKDHGYQANETLWGSIPAFAYILPGLWNVITYYTPAVVSTIGWLIFTVLASGAAIRKLSYEGKL